MTKNGQFMIVCVVIRVKHGKIRIICSNKGKHNVSNMIMFTLVMQLDQVKWLKL